MAVTKVAIDGLDYSLRQQNIIINGNHIVDQRLGATRTGIDDGSGRFLSDRWQVVANGSASARWTGSIETSGGPVGNDKWLKLICTTADASPGANEMAWVRQAVEASNCQPLVDTSNGKIGAFTVSGQLIAASASSFPLKVALVAWTDDGTARQYVSDISVTASATWQAFSVTIPADATGSFANDNGSGMRIGFGLYGGSNRQATNNTWANYAGHCATSATHNWAAAEDEYIGFTDFKVEPGSFATGFEKEDYTTTLTKCQRYFRQWSSGSDIILATGRNNSTTNALATLHHLGMRAAPSLTVSAAADFQVGHAGTSTACTAIALARQDEEVSTISATVSSGLTAGEACDVAMDGGGTRTFALSAEI